MQNRSISQWEAVEPLVSSATEQEFSIFPGTVSRVCTEGVHGVCEGVPCSDKCLEFTWRATKHHHEKSEPALFKNVLKWVYVLHPEDLTNGPSECLDTAWLGKN